MKKSNLWLSLTFIAALFVSGCQTPSPYRSSVQVHKLAQPKTYEANFKVTMVDGDQERVVSTPRIVFKAGEPAKMEVVSDEMQIYAEVYASGQGDDPLALCQTRIRKDGKYVLRHSEIIQPQAK